MSATATIKRQEKTAQWMWTGFILMFFLIQATIWTIAISITANDPSRAVVADYDEKALAWDEQKAAIVASRQLGWTAEVNIDETESNEGLRPVTVQLLDRNQSPISGEPFQMIAFHVSHASQPQTTLMTEVHPGEYTGQLRVVHFGHWQFDATVERGDSRFLINQRRTIKAIQ